VGKGPGREGGWDLHLDLGGLSKFWFAMVIKLETGGAGRRRGRNSQVGTNHEPTMACTKFPKF
jgi:hypothetical protein